MNNPILSTKASAGPLNGEVSLRRDFDFNDGTAEPAVFNQHIRSTVPAIPSDMESQEGCSQKHATQQAVEITSLSNLKAYKYHYRISVRICRVWRPTKFSSETNDGLHCVLVDKQGNSVHAFMPEERVADMTEIPVQGQVYDIYQFNTRSYNPTSAHLLRVLENGIEVQFNGKTVFCKLAETIPPIPAHAFRLIEFEAVETEMNTQTILADVYGCIKAIKHPHM